MSSPPDAVRRSGQGVADQCDPADEGGPADEGERVGSSEPVERSEPTEPIPVGALSGQRPEPVLGRMSTVPGWLIATAAVGLVGVVGVLGFVKPGFFVTPVLDQTSVQNGVRTILRDAYRLPQVATVTCPADQRVVPGRSFTCVAVVNGRPSEVPVVIQDDAGRYQVGRPTP